MPREKYSKKNEKILSKNDDLKSLPEKKIKKGVVGNSVSGVTMQSADSGVMVGRSKRTYETGSVNA